MIHLALWIAAFLFLVRVAWGLFTVLVAAVGTLVKGDDAEAHQRALKVQREARQAADAAEAAERDRLRRLCDYEGKRPGSKYRF